MSMVNKKHMILLVEDDEEDRTLLEDAAVKAGVRVPFRHFDNGEPALEYLFRCRDSVDKGEEQFPLVVFLDLNLPMESGKKALTAIKGDPSLRWLPVIVFTTSATRQEISWAYGVGANSIIIKPFSYPTLVNIMEVIRRYWFEIVELP
jgi:CheY-like chemotaxis protein